MTTFVIVYVILASLCCAVLAFRDRLIHPNRPFRQWWV